MARGILYNITTEPDDLGLMNAVLFYERLDELGADYVEDLRGERAKEGLETLKQALKDAGFPIREITAEEKYDIYAAFTLLPMDEETLLENRKNYFRSRFTAAKKAMEELDETQFATDSAELYNIQMLLDDEYNDAVWLGDENGERVLTMCSCIRELQPNTTYYVAESTIFMH